MAHVSKEGSGRRLGMAWVVFSLKVDCAQLSGEGRQMCAA